MSRLRWHRYKRSRLFPVPHVGFWVADPAGGAALKGGPKVRSGIFVNLPNGLFGVEWRQ